MYIDLSESNTHRLVPRSNSNISNIWPRYLLVLLALVGMIVSIYGVNVRRTHRGDAPLMGTGWLTPPSYRQSQREYNAQEGDNQPPVPIYTEDINENDAGYYDADGVFHLKETVEESLEEIPPYTAGEDNGAGHTAGGETAMANEHTAGGETVMANEHIVGGENTGTHVTPAEEDRHSAYEDDDLTRPVHPQTSHMQQTTQPTVPDHTLPTPPPPAHLV